MIYFIVADTEPRQVKIGYTDNSPEKRLSSLQVGCPYDLFLYATIKGSEQIERWLHVMFKDGHLRGEWYLLSRAIRYYVWCALNRERMDADKERGGER